MFETGVQTRYIVEDKDPLAGFDKIRRAGFTCADFSLNDYLLNREIYENKPNAFFKQSVRELTDFFTPHKEAAAKAGVRIHQMHMPYPNYVPTAVEGVNEFLLKEMAPKSMEICRFFDCKYIVVHGVKTKKYTGSEEAEWKQTEMFLQHILPLAAEYGITICVENIYVSNGKHIVEGPCCNAARAAERIDRLNDAYGAEVLGFCFDTGHANLVGIEFESFLMTLGKRLKVLHIHDNDGVRDLHQMPFTFTKTRDNKPSTNWEGFIRALALVGYDGVLNFETSPVLRSFPEELQDDALHLLARIGDYFGESIQKLSQQTEGRS